MGRATAVTEAEAGAKAAQEAFDAKQQEGFDAQNSWAEMTTKEVEHKTKMQAYEPNAEALQQHLAAAKAKLLHLEGVVGTFESLRSAKPASVEEPCAAEVVPADAVAAETTAVEVVSS